MVFKLDSRHDLTEQFRGMACKRLDQALAALRTRSRSARSLDTAVHKARKRIREVRALLRLMRAPMGEKAFKRENRALRDACRPLSAVRDATALIEAFKTLQAEAGVNAPLETFESTRKALRKRRQDLRRRALQQAETLEHSAAAVEKVRDRLKRRKLKHATRKTLKTALRRSCKQAQSAMAAALQDPTNEQLHAWRKRVKNLRHQLEFLTPRGAGPRRAQAEQARHLTDLLGHDHDLALLSDLLAGEFSAAVAEQTAQRLQLLIADQRSKLQASAHSLAANLHAAPPDQLEGKF